MSGMKGKGRGMPKGGWQGSGYPASHQGKGVGVQGKGEGFKGGKGKGKGEELRAGEGPNDCWACRKEGRPSNHDWQACKDSRRDGTFRQ